MEIRNYTPHTVAVLDSYGNILKEFKPTGIIPRVGVAEIVECEIDGIPIVKQIFGEVTLLPDPEENVMYIVSAKVKDACPNRIDLLSPARYVRDPNGVIIGCKAFARN